VTAIAALVLAACASAGAGSIELTVYRDGRYGIDGRVVNLEELEARLLTLNGTRGHVKVRVVVDREAQEGDVDSLVEVLLRVGADAGRAGN